MTAPEKTRWAVVCLRFVSAGFGEDKAAAYQHLLDTKHHTCRETHRVEYTDLKYGSRVPGEHTP